MTNILLEKALVTFIKNKLKDIKYLKPKKKDEETEINVKRGFFPPETTQDEAFPCVLIRTRKVRNNERERDFYITILVGLWHKETENGYDLLSLTNNRIIDELIQTGVIGEYFSFNSDSEWEITEEIAYPYWTSEINISFKGPKPEQVVNF